MRHAGTSGTLHFKRAAILVAAAILAVGMLPGCRSTRAGDRGKVLEAENINLRQQASTMEDQMRQAHAAQDDAVAREQQLRAELVQAEQEARIAGEARAQAIAAGERLSATQDELTRTEQALASTRTRYEQLLKQRAAAPAKSTHSDNMASGTGARPFIRRPAASSTALSATQRRSPCTPFSTLSSGASRCSSFSYFWWSYK